MALDVRRQVALVEARDAGADPADIAEADAPARIVGAAEAVAARVRFAADEDRADRRDEGIAQVADQHLVGDVGIVGLVGQVRHQELAAILLQVLARLVRDAILGAVFVGERDVAAPVAEVLSGEQRGEARRAVAILRHAHLRPRSDALKVAPQDEVGDAGDAVGAVHRADRAGQHVDARDQVGRDRVDVDRGVARFGGDMASAVDQRQRAIDAQVAQVQLVQSDLAELPGRHRVAAAAPRAVARSDQRRHAQQEVGDVGVARFLDVARVGRDDRVGRLVIGPRDAAAGNDDLAAVGLGRRVLRHVAGPGDGGGGVGRRRGLRVRGGREEERRPGQKQAAAYDARHVVSPCVPVLGPAGNR